MSRLLAIGQLATPEGIAFHRSAAGNLDDLSYLPARSYRLASGTIPVLWGHIPPVIGELLAAQRSEREDARPSRKKPRAVVR